MVMQTLLGSFNRANPAGRNLASKFAAEVGDNQLCHSFNAFNTCYKVSFHADFIAFFVLLCTLCIVFVVCCGKQGEEREGSVAVSLHVYVTVRRTLFT